MRGWCSWAPPPWDEVSAGEWRLAWGWGAGAWGTVEKRPQGRPAEHGLSFGGNLVSIIGFCLQPYSYYCIWFIWFITLLIPPIKFNKIKLKFKIIKWEPHKQRAWGYKHTFILALVEPLSWWKELEFEPLLSCSLLSLGGPWSCFDGISIFCASEWKKESISREKESMCEAALLQCETTVAYFSFASRCLV